MEVSYDCCEGLPEAGSPCSTTSPITSMGNLVDQISRTFMLYPGKACWPKRKAAIECLLNRFHMSEGDLETYAHSNKCFPYTRNLIASDGEHFSLLLLCWTAEKESKVHNHPCDGCFVKSIAGAVRETKYADPSTLHSSGQSNPDAEGSVEVKESCGSATTALVKISDIVLETGMVTYMDDYIGYHKVGNAGSDLAITLHLYTPPYTSCKVWMCPSNSAGTFEGNVTYYSEYGRICEETPQVKCVLQCQQLQALQQAQHLTSEEESEKKARCKEMWQMYI